MDDMVLTVRVLDVRTRAEGVGEPPAHRPLEVAGSLDGGILRIGGQIIKDHKHAGIVDVEGILSAHFRA